MESRRQQEERLFHCQEDICRVCTQLQNVKKEMVKLKGGEKDMETEAFLVNQDDSNLTANRYLQMLLAKCFSHVVI